MTTEIISYAQARGSRATSAAGAVRWLQTHPVTRSAASDMREPRINSAAYTVAKIDARFRPQHKRRNVRPVTHPGDVHTYRTDAGRYGGYPAYEYVCTYHVARQATSPTAGMLTVTTARYDDIPVTRRAPYAVGLFVAWPYRRWQDIPHVVRRALAAVMRQTVSVAWERRRKGMDGPQPIYILSPGTADEYHLPWGQATRLLGDTYNASIARDEIQAAQAKRRNVISQQADLRARAATLWVSADDSTRSGNCVYGTALQAARLSRLLHAEGPLGAVRGDVLLRLRDDEYTMRALAASAARVAG